MQEYKTKQDLRERTISLLRDQREEDRLEKSAIIAQKFLCMPEFIESTTILFYASFNGEVVTDEMIKGAMAQKKQIALPKIDSRTKELTPYLLEHIDDTEAGPFGIRQTKPSAPIVEIDDIDMVVVPGLAFDDNKHRLGRGHGYYDRFLSKLSKDVPTVGFAFDFQIISSLPQVEAHDIPLSHVLVN